MDKYKPTYLGKVIPADNPNKMKKFVTKQFDSFSKIYDACKDQSSDIKDIKMIDNKDDADDSLKVKVSSDKTCIEKIADKVKDDSNITVSNDMITAIN